MDSAINPALEQALEHAKQSAKARRKKLRDAANSSGSVIYFVQAGKHIKVGISTRNALKSRLNSIQTSNPYKIKLLKLLKTSNPVRDERLFHKLLRRYHVRGEWFFVDNPAILQLLGA